MKETDETYMHRCLELARLGAGSVAPNPMVGAVLVYENRIIGEGYHQVYGEAHAEVNCINSVAAPDTAFIPLSTLYVSLEPCAHFGKTPPCSDLIIRHQIKTVVIGCRDPFTEVDGKGIEKLQKAGVTVTIGVLEADCLELNKRFFTFVTKHRPYIILKWAQTANGLMAGEEGEERLLISNDYSNRLVHRWRSEEAALLVGTDTALLDNPSLTNRLWTGKHPVRIVVDRNLRLPVSLNLFDQQQKTIVINTIKEEERENLSYQKIATTDDTIDAILAVAYKEKLQSILVEGGGSLLHSFIKKGIWDEARVITNPLLTIPKGLPAPILPSAVPSHTEHIATDILSTHINKPVTSNQQPVTSNQ